MSLFELFLSFAKVGVMTFGGGYSMLPLLEKEIVEKHKLATEEELLNYYAIGQCTPGIIAVNTATFVGTKNRGVIGGIIATLGVIFPSFVIIVLLSSLILNYSSNLYVIKAFNGIRISVSALIASSVFKLSKKTINSFGSLLFVLLVVLLQLFLSFNSILIIICTVSFGIFYYFINERRKP